MKDIAGLALTLTPSIFNDETSQDDALAVVRQFSEINLKNTNESAVASLVATGKL